MKHAIKQFLSMEASGGIILVITAVIAFWCSNSFLAPYYRALLDMPVYVGLNGWTINKPLLLWVNDGLMALFFVLVSLEVKRELKEGALSTRERAMFPAVAAVGGMVFPAAIYLLFNYEDPIARAGWAIPAATDIAFALGVMLLLGKRVPGELKIFLLALAILDDLGAIAIIAIFYTDQLEVVGLAVAAVCLVGLSILNYHKVGRIAPYFLIGAVMWVAVLKSGVHATLAGVAIGFLMPLYDKKGFSPLKHVEHQLHPWSSFFILPIFAFANAGVSITGVRLTDLIAPLPLGIILGLFLGKPVGIWLMSFIAVKIGLVKLPPGVTMWQVLAVGFLCGIGFTMSMFIASLAFEHGNFEYGTFARLGILIGSTLSALIGLLLLSMIFHHPPHKTTHPSESEKDAMPPT